MGRLEKNGELQKILEENKIPFIGSSSTACQNMFHKYKASGILRENGFDTIPSELLIKSQDKQNREKVERFFANYNPDRVVVKPTAGGSSIGVFNAYNIEQALEKLDTLFAQNLGAEALIEPFCRGREFTTIVVQTTCGDPVSLIPTEIQMNYENHQIFDYRRKYLPTNNTVYHTPPRFGDEVVTNIRKQAKEIFSLFGMSDFTRLDGWVLDDGRIVFTDLNPVSGMEQNSFLFRQAARVGMTHSEILQMILQNACCRYNLEVPIFSAYKENGEPVYVLFGGSTAERQVSLMSGTNVWLKLRQSKRYHSIPFLLDKGGDVWRLPYDYTIDHTVEEIYENCITSEISSGRIDKLVQNIRSELGFKPDYLPSDNVPIRMTFDKFIRQAKQESAFIFLALHGGRGEDGSIQQILDENSISYNGSGYKGAQLCMDKYLTGHAIAKIGDEHIKSCLKKVILIPHFKKYSEKDYRDFWQKAVEDLRAEKFIIKPKKDGCSSGVVKINNWQDLQRYVEFVGAGATYIPANEFQDQSSIIELSSTPDSDYLLEVFIQTDPLLIENNELDYKCNTGWFELTVGVLENRGRYESLDPSITVADGAVLSLEEKFQGGTGVNITPPT